MKTGQEYRDSLRTRNIKVYIKGQLLDSKDVIDHPFIKGHVNSAGDPSVAEFLRRYLRAG